MLQSSSKPVLRIMAAAMFAAIPLAGCKVAQVQRSDETARFKQYLGEQSGKLKPQVLQQLLMGQCEQIALANSLSLRLEQMSLKIADQNVNIALSGALPNASANYTNTYRNNDNMVGNRHEQGASVQATVPILDWGLTYYSYQIAKDQRKQDDLLLSRSVQLLVRDVRIAYADHAGAVRQEKLLARALMAGQEVLRVARSLQNAGETVHADTSLVVASVAQAEVDLSIAQKRLRETHLILSQLMSLPPGMDYAIDTILPELPPVPTEKDVTAYCDRALDARPELAVQDLQRHISAYQVKSQATAFFPRIDGIGAFNYSGGQGAANSRWLTGGAQVSYGLLNGGADIFRYSIAKRQREIETAKTLLVSLGVVYDVEMRCLRVKEMHEIMRSADALEAAREAGMTRILSLYKEGLEDEAGTARALADLTQQATAADRATTDYLIAWHEMEAAVLPQHSRFEASLTTRPTTAPSTVPATLPSAQ